MASKVYSATYSGIPVWEFQFGHDLKQHVMRRRGDDWINATHILKAAGFDKPARTRVLEREVQKGTHEKIQGGYGKYQGTWIPIDSAEELARKNHVFEAIRPIFDFQPGAESPPVAPRHATKPKQSKKLGAQNKPIRGVRASQDYDNSSMMIHDDEIPDNVTLDSASYMAEDDHHDISQFSTGHRKRKAEEMLAERSRQQHSSYGDDLLDYFMLARNSQPTVRPDPPTNFQPDFAIDMEMNTSIHWASAMGDVDVVKELKRFGANLDVRNKRGETPLMRAVGFTNCFTKETFPMILRELWETFLLCDDRGQTVLHHTLGPFRANSASGQACPRYYLELVLNRLWEFCDQPSFQSFVDVQDQDGNTALHLAAGLHATKCVRTLLGRGASTHIANADGIRAEDLIQDINATRKSRSLPQRSSSPFAPESTNGLNTFRGSSNFSFDKPATPFASEAANAIESKVVSMVNRCQQLAATYEDKIKEKDDARLEAERILAATQQELAEVQARIEAEAAEDGAIDDEILAKINADVDQVQRQVTSLVTHQNRLAVEGKVQTELSMMVNGDGGSDSHKDTQSTQSSHRSLNGGGDDSSDERLRLAMELRQLVAEARQGDLAYVEALGGVGISSNIDKYRRLLRISLGPQADTMDENLDILIQMFEEEASSREKREMRAGLGIGNGSEGVNGVATAAMAF